VIKLMNRVLSSNRRRSLPRPELANPVAVLSSILFAPSSLRSAHQQDMAQISTLYVPRINEAGILSLSLAAHLRWLLSPTSLRVAKALLLQQNSADSSVDSLLTTRRTFETREQGQHGKKDAVDIHSDSRVEICRLLSSRLPCTRCTSPQSLSDDLLSFVDYVAQLSSETLLQ